MNKNLMTCYIIIIIIIYFSIIKKKSLKELPREKRPWKDSNIITSSHAFIHAHSARHIYIQEFISSLKQ